MASSLWWIIYKDLVAECRARRVWPGMLMYGIVVALVFSLQLDLLPDQKQQILGGLLWLAIFFAGMLAIDRSFAAEHEEDCWEGLLLYPVSPATLFLAKLVVNVVGLAVLQAILIPLMIVLSDAPLLAHPWALLTVAVLGNLGISAVGTLASAVANGIRKRGHLLVLVVLPLVIPVVLAAAEATRLISEDNLGPQWWQWTRLLGAFAVVYITAGITLFDFVVEE